MSLSKRKGYVLILSNTHSCIVHVIGKSLGPREIVNMSDRLYDNEKDDVICNHLIVKNRITHNLPMITQNLPHNIRFERESFK